MTEPGKGLQRWKSHKTVRAGQIKSIHPPGVIDTEMWVLQVRNEEGTQLEIKVPRAVFSRGIPGPGDYLVFYEPDGYMAWSPRQAFEDGYSKI